ncbi:MAG TPA: OsmC family protein [Rubrivivax sp.]|nr:OsmC family protein [Rubrivivax sp.]
MSDYTARVAWQRDPLEAFTDSRYSRRHELHFDGGAVLAGSSSPSVVPLPWSDAGAVDPEELFVASLASCHMLWFLSLAARQGFRVDRYEDEASGTLARNAAGRQAMTHVLLRPQVRCIGQRQPTAAELQALHEQAHEACFIANSVITEVRFEPRS